MSSKIVAKFGGSSVANAEQIEKVRKIVAADPARRFIVVSAPGKDNNDTEKVTDHLFNIATDGGHFKAQGKSIDPKISYSRVVGKFKSLIDELEIEGEDILADLEADLNREIPEKKRIDFFASRGEHYNAKVIARYFKKRGMPAHCMLPEEIGFMVSPDFTNAKVLPASYSSLEQSLDVEGIAVIPGYYGITQKGDVAVLSRGGSDLTGGEISYAITASLYENWTDTDGIYQVDPRIIGDAHVIPELTYKEIRLLSSKGFNVFHFDAMINCKKKNIPINVRNTNNPAADGTMIVDSRIPKETAVGIARMDDIAYIYIEKDMIGETIGFTKELLDIIQSYGINTHHYPSDKDDIAILVDQADLQGKAEGLVVDIRKALDPDVIELNYDLSILSPVGIGMKDTPGVLASAANALYGKNINIEIADQGPAQISFHFGLKSIQADAALQALYDGMVRGE